LAWDWMVEGFWLMLKQTIWNWTAKTKMQIKAEEGEQKGEHHKGLMNFQKLIR